MSALSHRNTTFDELIVGQTASVERPVTANDLYVFAHVSGNTNPLHMPGADLDKDGASDTVAPSLWVGSLVSSVLGTILPGAGTLYHGQTFRFPGRALMGDRLTVSVRCIEKREAPLAVFETRVEKADGTLVLEGIAEVSAPTHSIVQEKRELPLLLLDQHDHFGALVARCRRLPPMPTAIVCPDDANSLGGAVLSMREGLIEPILIGSRDKILRAADAAGADISALRLIDIADHSEAARQAVAMVHAREARAVMKGNVHSDELLGQVVKKDGGLRGSRRISHVFVMDAPTKPNLLFISDAAINIAPDLTTKVDIVQNAIDLAIACGLAKPKVGILAAVETVNINMPSTLEAAALAKMADRGQITGALVDGPLAMDNAVDIEAARTKGIVSSVAGQADVLIVPNLEAGNMLAKQLTFVARAEAAGLVVGAKAPVILTSRADNDKARLASCAVAQLYDYWRQNGEPLAYQPLLKAAE
ncbi:bifunctional enoyl-CoA hydratase/phosphate acetyltransferase [Bosea sp. BK604]|uniref:bifunctional enoyl-CoA hydratase/phosphate acetyltransferase n=1 Tax=Bosea sp. BK604 TaxID=2512180 RepID=UPI0010468F10|nr:bifunctional enoyl-CoA hydratase/phosphate acetyltransferase [Bosea sp. BK604]TCR70308.1 phosphate butyryltransferase [Bosea sp. BK604]